MGLVGVDGLNHGTTASMMQPNASSSSRFGADRFETLNRASTVIRPQGGGSFGLDSVGQIVLVVEVIGDRQVSEIGPSPDDIEFFGGRQSVGFTACLTDSA